MTATRPYRNDHLALLCWRLEKIIVGRAAAELQKHHDGQLSLAVLPVWLWRQPRMNMGRKGLSVVPVRIDWATGPVVLLDEQSLAVDWTATGGGWELSSDAVVSASGAAGPAAPPPFPRRSPEEVPSSFLAERFSSTEETRRRLQQLAEDGEAARWELLEEMGKMVRKFLWRARSSAIASLGDRVDFITEALFSETDIELAADRLVLGVDGKKSRADRLIDRCCAPRAFSRVDPLRYVAVSLRCSARQAIGCMLGDPDAGSSIRNIAAELGLPSHRQLTKEEIQLVVKAYRALHPNDRLGVGRADAATRPRHLAHLQEHRLELPPDHQVEGMVLDIVKACMAEGGATLAEVAQRWLAGVATGEEPSHRRLADELWLNTEEVRVLVDKAREISARELAGAA